MTAARLGLFSPLANPAFGRLFAARSIALVGSGLTTIALSLLAYDLAGGQAGFVLGSALALKMIAYVSIAPVVGGLADRLPRRALLVGFDLVRAVLVLALVLVSAPAEIYLPIFLLSACSAGFTPIFQAAIPDLLRDSAEYTKGLALSRVSYDLEGLLSPSLSTLVLLLIGYPAFFMLNAAAFVLSAVLIGTVRLPATEPIQRPTSVGYNLTFGVRSYLATPRLRGLLALCTAVSLAGAMVIVNTVVLVRDRLGGSDVEVALGFAATGAGSLVAALATPALLRHISLRTQMLYGAGLLPVGLVLAAFASTLPALLLAWVVVGSGMSLVQTAAGRVIESSCSAGDRPAFFSAHFSLSHAAWLFAYPLAGWVGAAAGMQVAFWLVTVGAALACLVATRVWPSHDPEELWHAHEELEHRHLHGIDAHHDHAHEGSQDGEPHAHAHRHGRLEHTHRFVIDAHHPVWPR
jgi:predicted MFS family arabinose efflux permease